MIEIYQTALSYAPISLFAIIGSILFLQKKLTFNKEMLIFIIALIGNITLSIFSGNILLLIIQLVVATIIFIAMVFILSGKISGETILTISSMFALTPLMHGLFAFFAVFLILMALSLISMRRDPKEWSATIANAVLSTGLGSRSPNYEYMPDRKELSADKKRISLLPIIAVVYTLFGLFYALRPLWLDF